MHPIIQSEVDEFEKEFLSKTFDSYQGWTVQDIEEVKSFLSAALQRAIEKAGKEIQKNAYEEIDKLILEIPPFPSEKSTESAKIGCITGIAMARCALSKLDTIINFKENEK